MKNMPTSKKWTRLDYIKIAARAEVDPRTVEKYLKHESDPRPAVLQSIRRALKGLGLVDPRDAELRGVL